MCKEGKCEVQIFGFQVKKFKFVGVENLGYAWTNWSVSQKVQKFGEVY